MAERLSSGRDMPAASHPAHGPLAVTGGMIEDNAKRSISVRINTSDYGRIRIVARRLRTREAEIFRYLLQIGLSRITSLLGEQLDAGSYLEILAELGPDLMAVLDVDARELATQLMSIRHQPLPEIRDEDFELLELAALHPRLALERLGAPGDGDVRAALLSHLRRRYQPERHLPGGPPTGLP